MKKELFRQFDSNRFVYEEAEGGEQTAQPAEAPAEAPKEEKVGFFAKLFGGGKKKEAPAEPAAAEAPAEPAAAEAPAEPAAAEAPATCPNCGGEMAEGHVCPVAEPAAEAPAEPAAEAPAAPEAPAEEEKAA